VGKSYDIQSIIIVRLTITRWEGGKELSDSAKRIARLTIITMLERGREL
jgi:hypothetical protein